MKKLALIQRNPTNHWVGNGFPVRSIFSYNNLAEALSPFLLLDYAGPTYFPPTDQKLGVGEHPHRGFETVTIIYDGEVEHRDSSGGGGMISAGEVQWMTAASGLVHEEFHGTNYAKHGGRFEMIQLWVNLPRKHKMDSPNYQTLTKAQIPTLPLKDDAGILRVIAGEYEQTRGPARTFTPMNVWDIRLTAGKTITFHIPNGWTTSFFVLNGQIKLHDGTLINAIELAVMEREGNKLVMTAEENAQLLLLSGHPLNEPIVGHGPFVMNTDAEIRQAMIDYQNGKMGNLN